MTESRVKVGDWVNFYQAGHMVWAPVLYVQKQPHYPHDIEALTPLGAIAVKHCIEVREAPR